MTMTCGEFSQLEQDERLAVVKEILSEENSAFGPLGDEFAETMANTMCEFMPDRTVRAILTGGPDWIGRRRWLAFQPWETHTNP